MKHAVPQELVNKVWDQGERVAVLDGDAVQPSVINHRSPGPIFLFDKEEGASGDPDELLLEFLFEPLVQFHLFVT